MEHTQYQKFKETFTEIRKIVKYGPQTVTYRASFPWANLHNKYKKDKSLDRSKTKVKT